VIQSRVERTVKLVSACESTPSKEVCRFPTKWYTQAFRLIVRVREVGRLKEALGFNQSSFQASRLSAAKPRKRGLSQTPCPAPGQKLLATRLLAPLGRCVARGKGTTLVEVISVKCVRSFETPRPKSSTPGQGARQRKSAYSIRKCTKMGRWGGRPPEERGEKTLPFLRGGVRVRCLV